MTCVVLHPRPCSYCLSSEDFHLFSAVHMWIIATLKAQFKCCQFHEASPNCLNSKKRQLSLCWWLTAFPSYYPSELWCHTCGTWILVWPWMGFSPRWFKTQDLIEDEKLTGTEHLQCVNAIYIILSSLYHKYTCNYNSHLIDRKLRLR